MDSKLQNLVEAWLRLDKNEETITEVKQLLAKNAISELQRRMGKRIEFGTAGLRGRMEAGWARMNDLTVIQASQGLSAYVQTSVPSALKRGVVIGHDHRHHSARWARLTAMVFLNRGFKVYLHRDLVHTPLVPFSVSRLNAACGVMITASHNPKCDNGYKVRGLANATDITLTELEVYWENAVQIIAPHDVSISDAIEKNLDLISWDESIVDVSLLMIDSTTSIWEDYFNQLTNIRSRSLGTGFDQKISFVNTSLHGVSHSVLKRAFQVCALPEFVSVKQQEEPDADFPTLAFPNPEEKGALNLAIEEANKSGADYILSQDPDADRFAAAERRSDGQWTLFTGDQIGSILASRIFDLYIAEGRPRGKLAMVASTVSSKFLSVMAKREGFIFVETLTGFKFIGNKAKELQSKGFYVPFGYEEAIGYMIGTEIRDKDGIAATICFADFALALAAEGRTVSGYLEQLYEKYGYFETANSYFICDDSATIDRIFSRLREFNGNSPLANRYPITIAGLQMQSVRDLTLGFDSSNAPSYQPSLPLSSGHMIQFQARGEDNGIDIYLTIRTSGTEPKIKYYLEGRGPDHASVQEMLHKVVIELRDSWMEASKNGLRMP